MQLQVINASLDEDRNEPEVTQRTLTLSIDGQEEEKKLPKVDPECTEHMKGFKKIISLLNFLGKPIGVKYQYGHCYWKEPGFYFGVMAKVVAYCAIIKSICVHAKNGEYVRILEPISMVLPVTTVSRILNKILKTTTSTVNISLKCCLKLYGISKNSNEIVALLLFFRSLSRQITEGGNQAKVLTSAMQSILKYLKMFEIFVFSCFVYCLAFTFKICIIDKELATIFPMEMLFCDHSTMEGVLVANILQLFAGASFILFINTYASTFILFIYNYITTLNLLAEDLKDLDKMWTGGMEVSVGYKHAFLFNICKKRQDMNR